MKMEKLIRWSEWLATRAAAVGCAGMAGCLVADFVEEPSVAAALFAVVFGVLAVGMATYEAPEDDEETIEN